MARLLRYFSGSLSTFLLALLLAVVIWANAVRQADPITTASLQLPLQVIPRPNGLVLTTPPATALVTVSAPASVLRTLGPGDFTAVADLSSADLGIVEIPVEILTTATEAQIVSVFPESITVELDQQITRVMPVTVETRGTVSRGHTAGDPIVDPPAITVTGPAREVDRLSQARTVIFMDNARETLVRTIRLVLYDGQGNVMSAEAGGLVLTPEQATVTIPVQELAGFAERTVSVNWVGEPAPGYRLLQVSVAEPRTVLLTGPAEALDNIQVLETTPIDITGLKASTTFRVGLLLPEGVRLVEQQEVEVQVAVEPILTSNVLVRPLNILNLSASLTATLSVEEVRIFLFGPLEELDALLEEDTQATVDLFGLDVGAYVLTPTLSMLSHNIEVRSLQPARVTVQITRTLTETDGGKDSAEIPLLSLFPSLPPASAPIPLLASPAIAHPGRRHNL